MGQTLFPFLSDNHTFLFYLFIHLYSISIWSKNIYRDFPGSPVVRTLPSNAGGVDLIPGWGAKIPHALGPKNQNLKQKQYCSRFKKDFKNGPHQKKKKNKTP